MDLENKLRQKLDSRKSKGNFRSLSYSKKPIDFLSNDYLGLARAPALTQKIKKLYDNVENRLNGSTGSRLLSGNSKYAASLEEWLAELFQGEKTLLFNSGYTANLSLLSSIPQKGDTIIYDELAHACMREGAKLSFAQKFSFKHNDLADLENKLNKAQGDKFVVVESIYSMDGDECPIETLMTLCQKYQAHVILDEAHSTGVLGVNGNGMACSMGLQDQIFARIYTFGKGMGVHGACVTGSAVLIDYLINFAKSFIYTTALPLHGLVSIRCSFEYLIENRRLQKILTGKINLFTNLMRERCKDLPMVLINSKSAIQAIIIPGNENIKKIAGQINGKGFDVKPILSPTVKAGEERLRICLHTYNTDDEIADLVMAIQQEVTEYLKDVS